MGFLLSIAVMYLLVIVTGFLNLALSVQLLRNRKTLLGKKDQKEKDLLVVANKLAGSMRVVIIVNILLIIVVIFTLFPILGPVVQMLYENTEQGRSIFK